MIALALKKAPPLPRMSAWVCVHLAALLAPAGSVCFGQLEFDREPIRYSKAEVDDPIARLQERLEQGDVQLQHDDKHGYLLSVLAELDVPPESQMLVFSKTSLQARQITPSSPRALYFNDDIYVGYVRRGDVIELSAVDAQQGPIFYTLAQQESEQPRFVRDRGHCLSCHASARTRDVPGFLMRSVYTSASGLPYFGAGSYTSTHSSPLRERWGGWYVTGEHGAARHMGNVVAPNRDDPEQLDLEAGANVAGLEQYCQIEHYPTPHSDIVALMVLGHQGEMHNWITRANFSTRTALYQSRAMNEALGRPLHQLSESTERRLDSVAEKLVSYLLFVDEAKLQDPIRGTSDFAEKFAELGPFDRQGRTLRQFDLVERMFAYPLSYLIYSDSFNSLPEEALSRVYRRLWDVLTGRVKSREFAHLHPERRQAILEILRDTKEDLPDYWREDS